MLWIPLLAAAVGQTFAFAGVPVPGEISGRWKLVRAECAAGAVPDPNAVPVGEQGSVELTVFANPEVPSIIWSRFVKKGACWSSVGSLLFLGDNDEGTGISSTFPGYVFLFDEFIRYRGFRVGLKCEAWASGKDPLFGMTNQFYRRPGDDLAEFRWLSFNSLACLPRQDLALTFRRLLN